MQKKRKIKRRLKKKWVKLIINSLLAIFIVIFLFSMYKICTYKVQEKELSNELEVINDSSAITEVEDSTDTEVITQEEKIDKSNPYWDYINMNLMNVDFKDLKETNNSVKGWIKVNGTNINYPFVQGDDNKYYLTHSLNKSYNASGWVFLDYRNDISSFNDKNTIIYAHAMRNKTMFGSLRNILKSGWLNNTDNYVIKLSTEYENTLWQVFSVYHIPTTSDYLQIDFSSDNEFIEFSNMLIKRSAHNFNTKVSSSDRILTLSTCYSKTEKIVLHAKLIKREAKKND